MAVQPILDTDTLESGFRVKYDETVGEIITGYRYPAATGQQPNGYTLRLLKFGGGFIEINLQQFYYTKQQIADLLNGIIGASEPIVEPIPTNSDGQFAFAYDGSRGLNPQFYVQQLVGDDILNRYDITVKINNAGDTITALSDFSMDSYQLVIRK